MLLVWLFCSEQMILFIRITDENVSVSLCQSQEVLQNIGKKCRVFCRCIEVLMHIKSQHGIQVYTAKTKKCFCLGFY